MAPNRHQLSNLTPLSLQPRRWAHIKRWAENIATKQNLQKPQRACPSGLKNPVLAHAPTSATIRIGRLFRGFEIASLFGLMEVVS